MELNQKTEEKLETLGTYGAGLGVGWLAFSQEVTAKYDAAKSKNPEYGLLSKWRFADTIATVAGVPAAKTLVPDYTGASGIPPLSLHPLGFMNKTVAIGIGILAINALATELVAQYRKIPVVNKVVNAAGWGAVIGGAIGGILDPESNNANAKIVDLSNATSQLPKYQYTAGLN